MSFVLIVLLHAGFASWAKTLFWIRLWRGLQLLKKCSLIVHILTRDGARGWPYNIQDLCWFFSHQIWFELIIFKNCFKSNFLHSILFVQNPNSLAYAHSSYGPFNWKYDFSFLFSLLVWKKNLLILPKKGKKGKIWIALQHILGVATGDPLLVIKQLFGHFSSLLLFFSWWVVGLSMIIDNFHPIKQRLEWLKFKCMYLWHGTFVYM